MLFNLMTKASSERISLYELTKNQSTLALRSAQKAGGFI